MTIEEIKQAKKELENNIARLIADFSNGTTLKVSGITIKSVVRLGEKEVIGVQCDVEL